MKYQTYPNTKSPLTDFICWITSAETSQVAAAAAAAAAAHSHALLPELSGQEATLRFETRVPEREMWNMWRESGAIKKSYQDFQTDQSHSLLDWNTRIW
jgi:hypothetical protein